MLSYCSTLLCSSQEYNCNLILGKKIARYGAEYVLGGFLPIRIVKQAVAVAPYQFIMIVITTIVTNTTHYY